MLDAVCQPESEAVADDKMVPLVEREFKLSKTQAEKALQLRHEIERIYDYIQHFKFLDNAPQNKKERDEFIFRQVKQRIKEEKSRVKQEIADPYYEYKHLMMCEYSEDVEMIINVLLQRLE